jgi:hypothetical protein
MTEDAYRYVRVALEKRPIPAQNAELDGEAAAVVVAAAAQHLAVVGFRQCPVASEFLLA